MIDFFWFLISLLVPESMRDAFQQTRQRWRASSRQFNQEVVQVKTIYTRPEPMAIQKPSEADHAFSLLTPREQDVVGLVCLGQKNWEIAAALGIAPGTVKTHLEHIFFKLKMNSKTEIRMIFRNWDFQTWCMDRQILGTRVPPSPRDR